MRSREFAAIPLVVALLGFVGLLVLAVYTGPWAWILLVVFTVVAAGFLFWWYSKRHPHPSADDAPVVAQVDDEIFRVLVVADEGCSADALRDELAARSAGRPTRALVIAPSLSSRLDRLTGDEQAYQVAQDHLSATLEALNRIGVEAEGHIGPHDPIQAADDGLREFPADLIVFATPPVDSANRLEKDLAEVASSRYDIPVAKIGSDPADRG
jgi:hypothetical protein